VESRLTKLSGCGLSAFGKATAANSYAISQPLYHAEFAALPLGVAQAMEAAVSRVVLHRKPTRSHGFTPVAYVNSRGRPSSGGLGVLPLYAHVQARKAKWLLALALPSVDQGPPPWVRVAFPLLPRLTYTRQYRGPQVLLTSLPSRAGDRLRQHPRQYAPCYRRIVPFPHRNFWTLGRLESGVPACHCSTTQQCRMSHRS
jgi:hypothetical protein